MLQAYLPRPLRYAIGQRNRPWQQLVCSREGTDHSADNVAVVLEFRGNYRRQDNVQPTMFLPWDNILATDYEDSQTKIWTVVATTGPWA